MLGREEVLKTMRLYGWFSMATNLACREGHRKQSIPEQRKGLPRDILHIPYHTG